MVRILFTVVITLAAMGCAHRESQKSRDLLNCEYSARYDGRMTDAQRVRALEACGR